MDMLLEVLVAFIALAIPCLFAWVNVALMKSCFIGRLKRNLKKSPPPY